MLISDLIGCTLQVVIFYWILVCFDNLDICYVEIKYKLRILCVFYSFPGGR